MRSAMRDLKLDALTLVHAGEETYSLAKNMRAMSWRAMVEQVRPLK
jgi:hypothetical protein